jgi:Ca2+-binding EF-hand superfamily protein
MIRYAIIALVLGALCAAAVAADAFNAIDTDGHGSIDQEEAQEAGRVLFNRLDVNGDGKLIGNEIGDRLSAAVFINGDPDRDGSLNPEEWSALVTARLKSANVNGDGVVDRTEFGALAGAILAIVISENVAAPKGGER